MDPSLNSGFQNLQFSPNGQIQNVPRPIIPPISNNPSIQMNEADNMVQPFNFYQTIPRQDYQINPISIMNPFNQDQEKQTLELQTEEYGLPTLREHGQDYGDYWDNLKTTCSKKKDCYKKAKECSGCSKCNCVKKKCKVIGRLPIGSDMHCKVSKDCQRFCQCSDGLKPGNLCKCNKKIGRCDFKKKSG